MSSGDSGRASQADIKSVQIGAFATHVAGFKHEADVAAAAAANLGIAKSVLDNPIVYGASLVDVGGCTFGSVVRGLFDDAVGGDVLRRLQVLVNLGLRNVRMLWSGEIN